MRILFSLSVFLLAAVGPSGGAFADTDTDWAFDPCVKAHAACVADCRDTNDDGKGGAGCLVGCATKEVECVTGKAARGVTPWLERKTDELKDFLDDFLRDMPDWTPPSPPPSPPPSKDDGYDTT